MQAIIMSAYRDFEELSRLLDIYSKDFNCYVHIDKKSNFSDTQHLEILNKKKNVSAISLYEIKWGSYLHLLALHRLLAMATENKENTRFHIISDADFPVRPYSEFENFFNENEHNYIEVTDITDMPVMQKRYKIFHLQHILDRKSKNKLIVIIDKVIRNLQYAIGVKRKTSYAYKGLVWGSITREAAEICIKYLTPERILNLKYCENSEEFWLTNAILGSKLKDTVITDNLRYAVWDDENVNGPRVLNINDLNKIESSNAFFARKVTEHDDPLYKALQERFNGSDRVGVG